MPLLMELISLRVKAQIPAMIYKALCILHPTPLLLCLLQPQCLIAAPQTPGTVWSQNSALAGSSVLRKLLLQWHFKCQTLCNTCKICTYYTYIFIENIYGR